MDGSGSQEVKKKDPQSAKALVSISTILVGFAQYLPEDSFLRGIASASAPLASYTIMYAFGLIQRMIKLEMFCRILKASRAEFEKELLDPQTNTARRKEIKKEIQTINKTIQEQRLKHFSIE